MNMEDDQKMTDVEKVACVDGLNPIKESDIIRETIVFRAQICEQANRYDDMIEVMKELCQKYDDLTIDERDLLSCAYKNVIGSRRTSLKIINGLLEATSNQQQYEEEQQKQNQKKTPPTFTISPSSSSSETNRAISSSSSTTITNMMTTTSANKYNPTVMRKIALEIEQDLKRHCDDILNILTKRLIPSIAATGESRVFYFKMKGDYARYLCEICSGNERKERANESLLAYKTASERAMIELPPTHPVRLGLMLNLSVFYYEIMKSPERSCRLAKQAFDDAIAELDTLSEESYRDSTIIMQLLRDNLNLWESEQSFQQPPLPLTQLSNNEFSNQLQQSTITTTTTIANSNGVGGLI